MDAVSVELAHSRLSGVVRHTPVLQSRTLDEMSGGTVYLKMESFQRSGAFKFRGAFHALIRCLDQARERGVVTGSSGNHGGALALAARILGIRCTVVVPEGAVAVKLQAIRDFGAEIVACGTTSDERLARAQELSDACGMIMIPPYDHPDVIAGQGTVALEVVEQVPDLDVFLAPCGGGGLLAGCAAYLGQRFPSVQVFGVESATANDTAQSFAQGKRVRIPLPDTLADGIRTTIPGELTFPIVKEHCRGIVTVEESEILAAVQVLMLRAKVVAEPTGAVAVAALLNGQFPLDGRVAVAVVSGGNADPEVLGRCLGGTAS